MFMSCRPAGSQGLRPLPRPGEGAGNGAAAAAAAAAVMNIGVGPAEKVCLQRAIVRGKGRRTGGGLSHVQRFSSNVWVPLIYSGGGDFVAL